VTVSVDAVVPDRPPSEAGAAYANAPVQRGADLWLEGIRRALRQLSNAEPFQIAVSETQVIFDGTPVVVPRKWRSLAARFPASA